MSLTPSTNSLYVLCCAAELDSSLHTDIHQYIYKHNHNHTMENCLSANSNRQRPKHSLEVTKKNEKFNFSLSPSFSRSLVVNNFSIILFGTLFTFTFFLKRLIYFPKICSQFFRANCKLKKVLTEKKSFVLTQFYVTRCLCVYIPISWNISNQMRHLVVYIWNSHIWNDKLWNETLNLWNEFKKEMLKISTFFAYFSIVFYLFVVLFYFLQNTK